MSVQKIAAALHILLCGVLLVCGVLLCVLTLASGALGVAELRNYLLLSAGLSLVFGMAYFIAWRLRISSANSAFRITALVSFAVVVSLLFPFTAMLSFVLSPTGAWLHWLLYSCICLPFLLNIYYFHRAFQLTKS